jgi:ADP-heptose:LPS heptosyltransferase
VTIVGTLSCIYRKTGIHGAPRGTLLHDINAMVHAVVHRRARGFASVNRISRGQFGAIPYYNLSRVRNLRPVNGIALIFFIGIGDYMMATPMIKALHEAHPDLPIWAYVSSNADSVNSPLVQHLLEINPLIHRISTYRGRPRAVWTEYDFSDALKDIPSDFAILPVIYGTDDAVMHRGTSLLETFGLRVELPVPLPIAYKAEMSEAGQDLLASILDRYKAAPPRGGLICTHFGARSSGYDYPHAGQLAQMLIQRGFRIVSFSSTGLKDENLTEVDITKLKVTDSIELLRSLKAEVPRLTMISVNSLMWPISAALNIPNLGLHTFWDPSIHQYLYPNIYVMTQHLYNSLGPCRWFRAPITAYEERQPPDSPTRFTDYKPEYVVDSLETMLDSSSPEALS